MKDFSEKRILELLDSDFVTEPTRRALQARLNAREMPVDAEIYRTAGRKIE